MPVNHTSSLDKLLDYMPDLIEKTNNMMNTHIKNKKEETQTILQQMQKNSNKNEKSHENKDVKHEKNKVNADINKKYNDQDPDIDYEFEYDETLEDE